MKNNKIPIESRAMLSKYTTWISINLFKYLKKSTKEEKRELTNVELKELRVEKQYKFLTAYIAAILSHKDYEPAPKTILKNFVMRNINKLENGSKKSRNNEEYVSTRLVQKEFSRLLKTTFTVYKVKVDSAKRPLEYVDKIDGKVFLKKHKEITKLPSIDIF
jgi:radical SAM superfamily enzyme YgiQ (UPF0313 family)